MGLFPCITGNSFIKLLQSPYPSLSKSLQTCPLFVLFPLCLCVFLLSFSAALHVLSLCCTFIYLRCLLSSPSSSPFSHLPRPPSVLCLPLPIYLHNINLSLAAALSLSFKVKLKTLLTSIKLWLLFHWKEEQCE